MIAPDCKLTLDMKQIRIIRHLPCPNPLPPCALTIGNFDGVHRGHQAMLAKAVQAAEHRSLIPSAMTFEPHPKSYFARLLGKPEIAPLRINGFRDRIQGITRAGIEQIALLRFNQAMARMSPDAFVRDLLMGYLNVRWLIVGADFRYGHSRAGNTETLRQASEQYGFEFEILQDVRDHSGDRVSSSNLRLALACADMQAARNLIGRPYQISGHVLHGQKLGRTLGFPTMNVRVPANCAIRFGIYVVQVRGLGPTAMPGIASLGVRPTVANSKDVLLETHLIDANVDAYGKLVEIDILQHVRDEEKFPDLPTLTAAMQNDRQRAVEYFAQHGLQNYAESD